VEAGAVPREAIFRGQFVQLPGGSDWLYQDAQLPAKVQSIKLTFDYNILTYDAKIRLWFGSHQDGWGDQHAVHIERVKLECKVR